MLALNEIELKQTRFYQEVVEEGRQEGEQILLQRMLTRRFGAVPDWAQERLIEAGPHNNLNSGQIDC
jgi:predicted transposase YdaD